PGRQHAQPRGAAPAAQARPAAVDAKPVDPVVRSIGRLQKRFPNAFPKNPAPKLPLKIGIFEDLVAHAGELSLNEAELRDAIKTWCRGGRYWKSLVEGAARIDLSGVEAGKVTAQEAAGAQRLLAHRAARGAQRPAEAAANVTASAPAGSADTSASEPQADAAAAPASGETAAGPAGQQAEEQAAPADNAQTGAQPNLQDDPQATAAPTPTPSQA
ncbi:ProQ/FINO family protein, partial [Paraburkholderia sp.]|uniref:ProQ/FinO family protein n=1 Tax=Paraburkholderia sp. TaxID=1926495 RepID=UPI0039E230A7